MIIQIFGLLVLGLWAYFDSKTQTIPTVAVLIPCLIAVFINWLFLPTFGLFIIIFVVVRKKTPFKIGFGDVMALPFAIAVIHQHSIVALAFFSIFLAIQVAFFDGLPKAIVGDKVIAKSFVPVIFNAFFAAGLIGITLVYFGVPLI